MAARAQKLGLFPRQDIMTGSNAYIGESSPHAMGKTSQECMTAMQIIHSILPPRLKLNGKMQSFRAGLLERHELLDAAQCIQTQR